jgi:hypothetical protein
MSKLRTIQREVEKIKQAVLPEPHDHFELLVYFTWNRHRTHGKYGSQILVFDRATGKIIDHKAVDDKTELELLKDHYEQHIPDHAKQNYPHYRTMEAYMESQRCDCGYHKLKRLSHAVS